VKKNNFLVYGVDEETMQRFDAVAARRFPDNPRPRQEFLRQLIEEAANSERLVYGYVKIDIAGDIEECPQCGQSFENSGGMYLAVFDDSTAVFCGVCAREYNG
jgi:hypothetical protein